MAIIIYLKKKQLYKKKGCKLWKSKYLNFFKLFKFFKFLENKFTRQDLKKILLKLLPLLLIKTFIFKAKLSVVKALYK